MTFKYRKLNFHSLRKTSSDRFTILWSEFVRRHFVAHYTYMGADYTWPSVEIWNLKKLWSQKRLMLMLMLRHPVSLKATFSEELCAEKMKQHRSSIRWMREPNGRQKCTSVSPLCLWAVLERVCAFIAVSSDGGTWIFYAAWPQEALLYFLLFFSVAKANANACTASLIHVTTLFCHSSDQSWSCWAVLMQPGCLDSQVS